MSENKILSLKKGECFHIKASGSPFDIHVFTPSGEDITKHVRSVRWSANEPDANGKRSRIPYVTLELFGVDVDVQGELTQVTVIDFRGKGVTSRLPSEATTDEDKPGH